MSTTNWSSCPYRKVLKGDAHCAIAIKDGWAEKATDIVEVETCQKCPVPDWLEEHQCANLSFGRHLLLIEYSGGREISDSGTQSDCKANVPNFDTALKFCTAECPSFVAIQLDLEMESVTPLFESNQLKTDADIRQGILASLYRFHSTNPKRYGKFDVTPNYLMKAIGIDEQTLARVILPMEENDEIRLLRKEGDEYFQAVAITSKGIEHIDTNPLFRKLNTEAIRASNTFNVQVSGSSNTIAVGESAKAQAIAFSDNAELKKHFQLLFDAIAHLEESTSKSDAQKYAELARIEMNRQEPEMSLVRSSLNRIKDDVIPTAANVATIVQFILQIISSMPK